MRSFIKTLPIAALVLSLAAGGALAAEHQGHEDRGISLRGPENGDYYSGLFGGDGAAAPAVPVYQAPTAVRAPRLSNILSELRAANHLIDTKRSEGELNAVTFNRLRREEASIRARAVQVADLHGGAIPRVSYAHLQKDVRRLDGDIAHSA
ncbi:hypothetical protein [Sinorhizobium arboris]|uniref:hypothetical protein n=1 Tax=Sinorhizobium arboris TaxID=76745 RepID=UPI0004252A8A|nr:hypothetical protein [Sinorhizobium arboris]